MGYNRVTTTLSICIALLLQVGAICFGAYGYLGALTLSAFLAWITMNLSNHILHSSKMEDEVEWSQMNEFVPIVRWLSRRYGLENPPKVLVVKDDNPNAFSVSNVQGVKIVGLTTALLNSLHPDEITGVAAHELAHLRVHDNERLAFSALMVGIFAGTVNASFASFLPISSGNLFLILVQAVVVCAAALGHLAFSRHCEYLADSCGATTCGNPVAIISALKKIDTAQRNAQPTDKYSKLVQRIWNNVERRSQVLTFFSSHPSVRQRIDRLKSNTHTPRVWV